MKTKKVISTIIIFAMMVAQFSFLSVLTPKVTYAAEPGSRKIFLWTIRWRF